MVHGTESWCRKGCLAGQTKEWLGIAAYRNDRWRSAHLRASLGGIDAIFAYGLKPLGRWRLIQQHQSVAHSVVRDLYDVDFQRSAVNPAMHLASRLEAIADPVPPRLPAPLGPHLGAKTADQQMEARPGVPALDLDGDATGLPVVQAAPCGSWLSSGIEKAASLAEFFLPEKSIFNERLKPATLPF